MKRNIRHAKFLALKSILNSYEIYKGGLKSRLEICIKKLQSKLGKEDYTELEQSYKDYIEYLVNIFANTRNVFVKLKDTRSDIVDFEDVEDLFKDLE